MKKIIMYLGWNYDFGHHWNWHEARVFPDYEPYWVEIPEDFHLGESKDGKMMYYRGDDDQGYQLFISENSSRGCPVLVGGSPVETIHLNVLGPVSES